MFHFLKNLNCGIMHLTEIERMEYSIYFSEMHSAYIYARWGAKIGRLTNQITSNTPPQLELGAKRTLRLRQVSFANFLFFSSFCCFFIYIFHSFAHRYKYNHRAEWQLYTNPSKRLVCYHEQLRW